MKKLLVLLLLTPLLSLGQSDTTALADTISANFPDNTSGFITPQRLRNVALELMRSNANLKEENVFTEPQEFEDSVKTLDNFYTWSGSAWEAISDPSDTTVWSRSGGFILPLEYSDKLRVDTARLDGLLYPTGNVNIGQSSAPFDTVFADVFDGVSGAWIESADSLYVTGKNVGIGTTGPVTTLDIVGTFTAGGDTAFVRNGTYDFELGGGIPARYDGLMMIKKVSDTLYSQITGSILADFGGGYEPLFPHINRVEIWELSTGINASVEVNSEFNVVIQKGDLDGYYASVIVGDVVRIDTLIYADGNEALGAKLVSDASGNANWQLPSFGEMGFGDSSATIALTQNTPAWVTNPDNDLWSLGASEFSNGVSYSNDSLLIETAGIYQVNIQLSIDGSSGSIIELQLFKNGLQSCLCSSVLSLTNNKKFSLSYNDIIDLADDDVLRVFVENTADNNDVDVLNGKITLHRLK